MRVPRVGSVLWAVLLALVLLPQIPEAAADHLLGQAATLNYQAVKLYDQGRFPEAEPSKSAPCRWVKGYSVQPPRRCQQLAQSLCNLLAARRLFGG
jgi:hypothetical protein